MATYNWKIKNFEEKLTTSDLVRKVLKHRGYQLFIPADMGHLDEEEQIEIAMGPQTDITDPSKMIERARETQFFQICWFGGPNPGIRVQQVESEQDDVEYVIENEIIETDQREQADMKPSIIMVDGNEHSWTEYQEEDIQRRYWKFSKYFDLPELKFQSEVRMRAMTEAGAGIRSFSPGGRCVYRTYFNRLDHIQWIDPKLGFNHEGRISSMNIEVDQGVEPFQRVDIGLEPITFCPPVLVPGYLALDRFQRSENPGMGTADIGGDWTTSNDTNFWIEDNHGVLRATTETPDLAYLGDISETAFTVKAKFAPKQQTSDHETTYDFGLCMRYADDDNWHMVGLRISPNKRMRLVVISSTAGVRKLWTSKRLPFREANSSGRPWYWVEAKIFGTNPTYIRAKAWKDKRYEPKTWQFTKALRDTTGTSLGPQAAGSPGLYVRMADNAEASLTYYVDQFEVTSGQSVP